LTGITCTAAGGAVCPDTPGPVMNVASIPVGGSLSFVVNATVGATGSGTISITNTMSATISDDINRSDNSATAQGSAFKLNSNVVVTGSGPVGVAAGGGPATFVMSVRNDGPDPATGVHIVDTVGGNLTITGVTCTASGGATCPATLGIVMDVDTLPMGGTLDFAVATTVGPGISGTIANTLAVTTANDPDRTDNTAVATGTAYTARAGVFVFGVGPSSSVLGGGTATFTMTVSNAGPDVATDVQIVNTVGGNLTLTSITCSASGVACPTTLGPAMNVASLPIGATLTFTV